MARSKYPTALRYTVCFLFEDRGLTAGQIAVKLNLNANQVNNILNGLGVRRGDAQRIGGDEFRREITAALTHERLRWAHGDKRADLISEGLDRQTGEDIASWERLGSLAERRAA